MNSLTISYTLEVMYRQDEDTGDHVGWCPLLQLYSQGESQEEAEEALKGAILLYLRICYERRILDDVLHRHGLTKVRGVPDGEVVMENCQSISIKEYPIHNTVSIPLSLVQEAKSREVAQWA